MTGNTFFGKIDNKVKFNCILNYFRSNEEYNFTDSELEQKILALKDMNKLREKYKNFSFIKCFIIKQKNKGKDWDMALVMKCKEKEHTILRLILIQISINKTIKQIINILQFLDRKIKFIKRKIFRIMGININYTHILFIFNSFDTSPLTAIFCKEYEIPFIFFNPKKNNFISNKNKVINLNDLLIETSYLKHWDKWKECLNYEDNEEEKINDGKDENYEDNNNLSDEVYEEKILNDVNFIQDKHFSLDYFN